MDVVSDAIAVMRTGSGTANRIRLGSPWRYRFAPYDGAGFHVLLSGSGWLVPADGPPVALGPGDAVLIPHGDPHVLSDSPTASGAVPFETAEDDPAGATDCVCGKYRLDRARAHPLLAALPPLVHIPAHVGRHTALRSAVDLLATETQDPRPGGDAAVAGLLDLLLVYLVRAWLDDNPAPGWVRAVRDREVAAALTALHSEPAHPWRVEELAARVGLSRTTLARRFTELTGQPPMAYLTWWRMTTAARLLRDTDTPLPAVARRVGYASPYAFAHAFKRHCGVAPGRYRSA